MGEHTDNFITYEDGAAVGSDNEDGDDLDGYECAFCTGAHDDDELAGSALAQESANQESQKSGSFDHGRAHILPSGSVGLDSMSTIDIFGDSRLLTNIHRTKSNMRVICNAGSLVVKQVGKFGGYGDVWYHPRAIANMLSLQNVQKKNRVSFDNDNGNRFLVHRDDGTARVFHPTKKGRKC